MTNRGAFSKQKGASFEREICKHLSLWISEGKRDDYFWRSAMSGGRATVKFKKGGANLTQVGDISATCSEGEVLTSVFVVECKHYRKISVDSLFFEYSLKSSCMMTWWEQVYKSAILSNKIPMLIAKQNNRYPVVCIPFTEYKKRFVNKNKKLRPLAVFDEKIAMFYFKDLTNTDFKSFIVRG